MEPFIDDVCYQKKESWIYQGSFSRDLDSVIEHHVEMKAPYICHGVSIELEEEWMLT